MKKSIVFKPYDGMAAKVGDVVYSAYIPEVERAAPGKVVYTNETEFVVDWGLPNSLSVFTRVIAERHLNYGAEQFIVNGFEVPCPLSEEGDVPVVLYVAAPENLTFYWRLYPGDPRRKLLLIRRQLVHKTSFAAVAHAKAMLGIDPWKEASLEDAENGLNDPSEE